MNGPTPDVPVVIETTFPVTAGGEAGPTSLSNLINKYRCPIWVNEIRIASADVTQATFFQVFTETSTRIQYGRHWITNEFVPSGVLAPRWPGDGHVVMRLHKPLYVTPQDLIVPTIRSDVNITIRLSLSGRLATPLPKRAKVWVPYVTAFRGATTPIGSVSAQQSNRTNFANPFKNPLSVRFFIGQRSLTGFAALAGRANSQPAINVRMTDYLGRPVVRDPTPFFDLFNIRDQSWSVNTTLPYGGYYVANVAVNAVGATQDQDFAISMFGYREENIQWGT